MKRKKKNINTRKRRAFKKVALNFDCSSIAQAISKTGLRREIILALKSLGTAAFHPSGRIDSAQLIKDAAAHPEIVKSFEDIPDIRLEKALTARTVRREGEVRLEQLLQTIAPMDICRRILVRGGKSALTRLMTIPDRVSERYALMQDAKAIRENLIGEIGDAMRSLSEESVDKLIKDTLAEQ